MTIFAFAIAFYAGYIYRNKEFIAYLQEFKPLRENSEFTLISPLVGIDSPNAFDKGLYNDTREKIDNAIYDAKENGVTDVAIYYRDLNSSVWFGINEGADFVPASLLKMTYAFAAYKQGETEPSFLNTNLVYTQNLDDETRKRKSGDTDTVMKVGQQYSVEDAVRIMLVNSDNGARDLLQHSIKQRYVDEVFKYLGIDPPLAKMNFQISAAHYALFFRMLYSSTFVNAEHSQTIMEFLTQTNFPVAIQHPLPPDLIIAHKWGVYNSPPDANGATYQELHDCGVVYVPEKPYLICLMTKGATQEALASFMSTISDIIYKDMVVNR